MVNFGKINMENRLTRAIYDASPIWMQNIFATIYGYQKKRRRYGKYFARWRRFFSESFSWSKAELENYQNEQLQLVIRCAYEHVPYYRERFSQLGLRPEDIRTVADLPKLPLLEKDQVREAGMALVADNIPRRHLRRGVTGGSTGAALTTYWTAEAEHRNYGFLWARDRMGFEFGTPYASFSSALTVPPQQKRPPYWRRNYVANQTVYSVYHISPETMNDYLDDLASRELQYYEGYPTPMYILGRYLLEHPRPFKQYPRAVFTTSEELQPGYREVIEQAFHTRLYNQYGQGEKVACVSEYSCGHLHYDMDYGIIEFLPVGKNEEGKPICEMVCTGFQNFAAPLIRYRVGDLALLPDNNVACDVYAGPVVESIYGRTGHVLIGKTGRLFHNITAISRHAEHIAAIQCVQEQPGQMVVRVVPDAGWTDADGVKLAKLIEQRMGSEIDFTIETVTELEKTRRGKTLSIVSKVSPDKIAAALDGRQSTSDEATDKR